MYILWGYVYGGWCNISGTVKGIQLKLPGNVEGDFELHNNLRCTSRLSRKYIYNISRTDTGIMLKLCGSELIKKHWAYLCCYEGGSAISQEQLRVLSWNFQGAKSNFDWTKPKYALYILVVKRACHNSSEKAKSIKFKLSENVEDAQLHQTTLRASWSPKECMCNILQMAKASTWWQAVKKQICSASGMADDINFGTFRRCWTRSKYTMCIQVVKRAYLQHLRNS